MISKWKWLARPNEFLIASCRMKSPTRYWQPTLDVRLPRWADEGICTTVEHDSERSKHEVKLREFLRSRRGIPMNQLFLLTEYPSDVLPMYAQGYSVCQFLIAQKGPQEFIRFLQDYIQHPSWTANVRKHYEYESLAELTKLLDRLGIIW